MGLARRRECSTPRDVDEQRRKRALPRGTTTDTADLMRLQLATAPKSLGRKGFKMYLYKGQPRTRRSSPARRGTEASKIGGGGVQPIETEKPDCRPKERRRLPVRGGEERWKEEREGSRGDRGGGAGLWALRSRGKEAVGGGVTAVVARQLHRTASFFPRPPASMPARR